jgi:hypothetical protein
VIATDLVPRMNDYAGYLGQEPPVEATARGFVATDAYYRTMQSRLYDFDGSAVADLGLPALASFRLRFASRSGILRGGRFVARWKVFEITSDRSSTTP